MTARSAHRDSDRVPVFSLGERIRKAREDAGMSQQQFADELGIDRKTVGNWEADRNQPRYRDLMLISSVADVSLEWLAGELFRQHEPVSPTRPSRAPRRANASGTRAGSAVDTKKGTGRIPHRYQDALVAA
jgi:transcriptional regulator with XRE-family HTH domain